MTSLNAADLRLLFLDESSLHRMTSSAPPISQNVTESTIRGRVVYDVMLEEEPADRIGQSLSGEMVALIAGIRADFTSYGPRHPIRRALAEWERSCRRRHRPDATLRWRDHVQGPICGEMLRAVVEGGASYWWCSQRWGLGYWRARRLIEAGERFVAERYSRWQDDALGLVHDRDRCEQCREEDQGA